MPSPNIVLDCKEVPVLIQWGDTEPYSYLGTREEKLRMTIHLATQPRPELLFWFSITVGVTASPGSHKSRTKSLYFVIQASAFNYDGKDPCLSVQALNSFEYPIATGAAVREAQMGLNNASISRLHFRLRDHGRVFMPDVENQAFTPVSEKVADTLAGIQSLSQTKEFYVYTSFERSTLINFCDNVSQRDMESYIGDFTTQPAYKHGMVCDVWKNFNKFARKENPKNPVKRQSTRLGVENALDPPPQYDNSRSQDAGMKRRDCTRPYISNGVPTKSPYCYDRNQELVETESDDEESHSELKRKHSSITSDNTPFDNTGNATGPSSRISNKFGAYHETHKVRFAESPSVIQSELEEQLASFIRWILGVDLNLEKDCQQVFSNLGGAVYCGDRDMFSKIKSECMAKIYRTYVKRGSEWVLR